MRPRGVACLRSPCTALLPAADERSPPRPGPPGGSSGAAAAARGATDPRRPSNHSGRAANQEPLERFTARASERRPHDGGGRPRNGRTRARRGAGFPSTRFLGAPAPTRRGGRGAPVLEPAPVDVRRRRDALLPASGRPGGRRGWATNTASVGVWRTPAALWRVPGAQLPGYNGGRLPDTRWRPTRQQNWVSLHNGSWASLCLCRPRSAHFSARQRLCPLGVWTTTEAATIIGGGSTPPASGFPYDPRGNVAVSNMDHFCPFLGSEKATSIRARVARVHWKACEFLYKRHARSNTFCACLLTLFCSSIALSSVT
ncbi:hypothetical protein BU14_0023s0069 [Porphyra umbilicalis]|uniref:Uncharacterized protein n=1 Tax=Porphyra umbilicalis TaxID=2786 RepID=A0A1X6PKE1_PORUM|nr:hypothetical protein BU14_0023s0069 [Porphyra umbilicalis]|eukprot:OSX81265.1 hypothetical protein BU14_0023s0069 [Porphyra umbilicalis]